MLAHVGLRGPSRALWISRRRGLHAPLSIPEVRTRNMTSNSSPKRMVGKPANTPTLGTPGAGLGQQPAEYARSGGFLSRTASLLPGISTQTPVEAAHGAPRRDPAFGTPILVSSAPLNVTVTAVYYVGRGPGGAPHTSIGARPAAQTASWPPFQPGEARGRFDAPN
jgi:hypothetical protein